MVTKPRAMQRWVWEYWSQRWLRRCKLVTLTASCSSCNVCFLVARLLAVVVAVAIAMWTQVVMLRRCGGSPCAML